jgi:pimeloyl-ACP methyl ester carboxylesterase
VIITAGTAEDIITGRIEGDPADPPLLLLHGGPGLSDYLADSLGGELDGWRTISFQQRGLTGGPFTVERHVADTVAILTRIRTRRTRRAAERS